MENEVKFFQIPGRWRQVGRIKRSVTSLRRSPVLVLTNTSRHLLGGTLIFLHEEDRQVLFQVDNKVKTLKSFVEKRRVADGAPP